MEASLANPLLPKLAPYATRLMDQPTPSGQSHGYMLHWAGQRSPRGIELPDGRTIGWARDGVVAGVGGEHIGLYTRLLEGNGDHAMLLVLDGPAPVPNPGRGHG